jgi:hypothetical protein
MGVGIDARRLLCPCPLGMRQAGSIQRIREIKMIGNVIAFCLTAVLCVLFVLFVIEFKNWVDEKWGW